MEYLFKWLSGDVATGLREQIVRTCNGLRGVEDALRGDYSTKSVIRLFHELAAKGRESLRGQIAVRLMDTEPGTLDERFELAGP